MSETEKTFDASEALKHIIAGKKVRVANGNPCQPCHDRYYICLHLPTDEGVALGYRSYIKSVWADGVSRPFTFDDWYLLDAEYKLVE